MANITPIPDYFTPALELWANKFSDSDPSKKNQHYEWHVGAWAATMLKKVFSADEWVIIPERRNEDTQKKPDLVIEKLDTPYLLYELKSSIGDRLEDALFQTTRGIHQWVDSNSANASIYIIIQRACKIAFFEYHSNSDDFEKHNVPMIDKCVSLTQPLWDGKTFTRPLQSIDMPMDVLPLYYNYKHLRKDTEERKAAKNYKKRCVFDIRKHKKQINLLFHHILTNRPREGPDGDDSTDHSKDIGENPNEDEYGEYYRDEDIYGG